MYDYRRMTDEQKAAVVAERRARSVPLHKPPHPDSGEGWYFVSAATYEHRPHFRAPNELTALVHRLLEAFSDSGIARPVRSLSGAASGRDGISARYGLLAGWVVLPNHYHLLMRLDRPSDAGALLKSVHGRSAMYTNRRDRTPGRRVWYKYSDRKVRSERHWWTCLHYILFNPVKHDYVAEMRNWPWSCYHELLAEHGHDWIEDIRREYPLREFGRGWDE